MDYFLLEYSRMCFFFLNKTIFFQKIFMMSQTIFFFIKVCQILGFCEVSMKLHEKKNNQKQTENIYRPECVSEKQIKGQNLRGCNNRHAVYGPIQRPETQGKYLGEPVPMAVSRDGGNRPETISFSRSFTQILTLAFLEGL